MLLILNETKLFYVAQYTHQFDRFKFIYDFVVIGEACKIVIECDGLNHFTALKMLDDRERDEITLLYYDEVLRFTMRQINEEPKLIKREIINIVKKLDNKHSINEEKKRKTQIEKELLRNKDSYRENGRIIKRVNINKDNVYESKRNIKKQSKENNSFSNTFVRSNRVFLKDIVLRDSDTTDILVWNKIIKQDLNSKKILWNLIKNSNKDQIIIYYDDIKKLTSLLNNTLILINPFYRSQSGEISLIILPDSPKLLRIIKNF